MATDMTESNERKLGGQSVIQTTISIGHRENVRADGQAVVQNGRPYFPGCLTRTPVAGPELKDQLEGELSDPWVSSRRNRPKR